MGGGFVWPRLEEIGLVEDVELLEEDEREDGVRAETGVVRGEALPQAEYALFLNHLQEDFLQKKKKKKQLLIS